MKVNLNDLKYIYEREIKLHVKNKERLFKFERNKLQYLNEMKNLLESNKYDGGRYNIFIISEPKKRVVMSQSVFDKVINHYIARFILMPKLEKRLSPFNVATRKGMGLHHGIKHLKEVIQKYKLKGDNVYYIKLDIKKYFFNIDHKVLLSKMKPFLEVDECELMRRVLSSTNKEYINKVINKYQENIEEELPIYKFGKGLPIGGLVSQFLAVFYLSDLHHFIRHNLHLEGVIYMDDYIFISNDKEYLENCLKIIKDKINKEYKLKINEKKTYIANIKNGLPFLGYIFSIKNNKIVIRCSKDKIKKIKKGIKRTVNNYKNGKMTFKQAFCSIENYINSDGFANTYQIQNIIDRYWTSL